MIPRLLLVLLLFASAAGRSRAADRPLAIDLAHSRVDIAVRASGDSFTGKLARFDPAVMVNDEGRVVTARLAFHFRDVATGKDGRDKAMHTWQGTDNFPDGRFELVTLEPVTNQPGGYTASGKLTFHGVTRDLKFPVTIATSAGVLKVDGEATIDTREFGLPIIRMFLVLKVDPLVRVIFHLEGRTS